MPELKQMTLEECRATREEFIVEALKQPKLRLANDLAALIELRTEFIEEIAKLTAIANRIQG